MTLKQGYDHSVKIAALCRVSFFHPGAVSLTWVGNTAVVSGLVEYQRNALLGAYADNATAADKRRAGKGEQVRIKFE